MSKNWRIVWFCFLVFTVADAYYLGTIEGAKETKVEAAK